MSIELVGTGLLLTATNFKLFATSSILVDMSIDLIATSSELVGMSFELVPKSYRRDAMRCAFNRERAEVLRCDYWRLAMRHELWRSWHFMRRDGAIPGAGGTAPRATGAWPV